MWGGGMKMVLIEWDDSGAVDGQVWEFKDEWDCDVHLCKTVGFLVAKNKVATVVAQSENQDQWGRLFAIPNGCITRVTTLGASK